MIQKNLKSFEKNRSFDVKVFLGNKYNSYTARNTKVTSTRNVYEKTVMKRKKEGFQRRIQNPLEHLRSNFFKKIVNRVTYDWVLNAPLVLIIAKKLPRRQIKDSLHCVKSVQIRSFFWSVFSCIRTEYGDFRIKSLYSVRIQENTDQKKLHIWTLFTQCCIRKQLVRAVRCLTYLQLIVPSKDV